MGDNDKTIKALRNPFIQRIKEFNPSDYEKMMGEGIRNLYMTDKQRFERLQEQGIISDTDLGILRRADNGQQDKAIVQGKAEKGVAHNNLV